MRPAQIAWLIALGAAWGSSFLFMKIAVPSMGPAVMMGGRIIIAALALSVFAWCIGKSLPRGAAWKPAVVTGVFYTAMPLFLWGYASQTLPASLLSIINATAPLFGAAISMIWPPVHAGAHGSERANERVGARGWAGLALGFAGVTVLVGGEQWQSGVAQGENIAAIVAIAAAFGASILYGWVSNYSQRARIGDSYANVLGNLWVASLVIAPLMFVMPVRETPGVAAWGAVAMLGLVCTAVAYVVYFRLIAQIGAARTLTVTYLIPVFGVLWGALFLDEQIGLHHVAGAAMVLAGVALVAKARVAIHVQR